MNIFMTQPTERLAAWSLFRNGLSKLDELTQYSDTAKFWAQCPFKKRVIHPEDQKDWPTIWELIYDGEYCRNSIALGMESTLRLSGINSDRIKLVMVRNINDREEYFTVIIDDIHVLNYSYGETVLVDELTGFVDILYSYHWKGRSYKRLS